MKLKKYAALAIFPIFMFCSSPQVTVQVENPLELQRTEVISINWADVATQLGTAYCTVIDNVENAEIPCQFVDADADGSVDELLFLAKCAANESKTFTLKPAATQPEYDAQTFGRQIPERMDDYAWENDRVAFRMYGPALQATGEISSGVDVWSKSTHDMVIDKWYAPDYGSYHEDQGEGADFYKVGPSAGCGGTAVWASNEMYFSKNWITQKTIAVGPIRHIFELTYAAWDVDGVSVSETKRISLDAGSNLNRFESTFNAAEPLDIAIGIIKRDVGEAKANQTNGTLRYWQPIDDKNGATGCAVVIDPQLCKAVAENENHNFILTTVKPNEPLVYYSGACWDKSKEFSTVEEWDAYIAEAAQKIANPVLVTLD